jgi:hypothetical protein
MDQGGRTHTVAVPDWADVVEVRVDGGAELTTEEVEAVHLALDEIEEEFFEQVQEHRFEEQVEAQYVNAVPEPLILRATGGNPASVAASLAEQLRAQPLRWRIDYLEAVRDLLDDPDGFPSD